MKNSDLNLDAEVKSLLEQELARDIPNPNSPDFQKFLEELQAERPDLFDEVMRGLQVNVSLPVEQQAQRAEKREQRQANVRRTFFRTSQVDGTPVMAKRRLMMLTLGGIALLFSVVFVLGQMLPGRGGGSEDLPPLVQEAPEIESQGAEALEPPDVDPEPIPMPILEPEPEPEPELTSPPKVPEKPVPLPPPPRETKPVPPAPTPAPAPAPAPAVAAPEPEAELPTSLSVYEKEETLPTSLNVLPESSGQVAPQELSVYGADGELPSSLSIETGNEARPDSLSVPTEELAETPDETVLFDINQVDETGDSPTGGAVAGGQNTQGQPSANVLDLFQAGTRVPAQLVTGILVAEGGASPIVAQTVGDWCTSETCPEITWIGRAILDELNRVQITLDQAILGDELRSAQGIALAADLTPGLTAEIRDESPSIVQQLASSSLGGVSDYVNALTNQQKVTILDGIVLTETQVPEIDNFVLGRIASLFSTPQGADEGTRIRVAEVPAASEFVILYGVDAAGETDSAQPPTPESVQ